MVQCIRCFALNPDGADECRTCQATMPGDAGGEGLPGDEGLPGEVPTAGVRTISLSAHGSAKGARGRPRPLFYVIGSALALSGLFVFGLDGTLDREVIASAEVDSRSPQARQAEIRAAAEALEQLLARLEQHLERRDGMDAATRTQWIGAWEGELQGIKGQYKLWGSTDARRQDAAAEGAIHNALLYLVSLERMAIQPGPRSSEDYVRLRSSFSRSIAVAIRP